MVINQLFVNTPPINIIDTIFSLIISGPIRHNVYFTYDNIYNNLHKITILLETSLVDYYLPCKYKQYFIELNPKRIVTILRQILQQYKYKILSKEYYDSKIKKKKLRFILIDTSTYNQKNMFS